MAQKKKACEICGGSTFVRRASARKPYHYRLSGLERVFLIGVEVESCRECGMESPAIPRLGQLHQLIARNLVHKPDRLAGEELRFLRKLTCIPAKNFAELLRVTPEHLSGAENDRRALSRSVDKLARAILAETLEVKETRSILLRFPTEVGEKPTQLRFAFNRRWTRAA